MVVYLLFSRYIGPIVSVFLACFYNGCACDRYSAWSCPLKRAVYNTRQPVSGVLYIPFIHSRHNAKGSGSWYKVTVMRMRWTRKTVKRMRLTERRRELIPQVRLWNSDWWFVMRKIRVVELVNNRWGAGSTCRLNRDEIVWVVRLAGCKNFVGELQEFIFNAIDDHSL